MHKYLLISMLVGLAFLLVACGSGETPPPPTLFQAPTQEIVPSNTSPPTRDIQPSRTPLGSGDLPPTWTFTPEPSATVTPTPTTFVQPQPIATIVVSPTICDSFVPDTERSQRDFPIGASPVVAWTPVHGAVTYRLSLVNDRGEEMQVEFVAETSYQFPAELFELGGRYGWEVYPRDSLNVQMCYGVGGELIPFRQ